MTLKEAALGSFVFNMAFLARHGQAGTRPDHRLAAGQDAQRADGHVIGLDHLRLSVRAPPGNPTGQ